MRTTMNKYGFTLVELLMAVSFTTLLMAGVLGFFNASRQDYTSGISGQALEDGANLVLKKITEGVLEPNGTLYRLATSAAYYIPNGTLNTLYYCQDNPQTYACGPADVTVRRFTVDATSTKLLYYYSSSAYKMIYTAPTGTTLTLRFSPASVATNTSYVLEIDVALNTKLSAKITNSRLATSGTASTFVLLRNHP